MNIRLWLGRGLMIWSGFTLLCAVALVTYLAYQFGPGNKVEVDMASKKDVRFVLNWCELGDERIERVVHSYVSPRSITGDHLDAYAIKISRLDLDELSKDVNSPYQRWYRADNVPQVLNDAIEFMGGWLHEVSWFPEETALRTSQYYVYPWSIGIHGTRPTAAKLIFLRPSDNMVFYFGGKT